MNPAEELKKISIELEQTLKQSTEESAAVDVVLQAIKENPEGDLQTFCIDAAAGFGLDAEALFEKVSEILEKRSKKSADSSRDVAAAINRLLTQLANLEEARGSIEQAIHETSGEDSTLAKNYYDADTHIDEAIRSFRMLKNEALGI